MRKGASIYGLLVLLYSGGVLADMTLTNRDSKPHEITIKCSTTVHTSIGANVTRGIGRGPCTVTLKNTKSIASGSGNDQLLIRNGAIGKQ